MAARTTASKGGKPDKLMRDALMLELHEVALAADGTMTKKLRLVARSLVDQAIGGSTPAALAIFDRVDGKVPQPVENKSTVDLNLNNDGTDALAALEHLILRAAAAGSVAGGAKTTH